MFAVRRKYDLFQFLNSAPFLVSNYGKRPRLRLPHGLEVRRDVEVASGGLDDVIDGEAFADLGQGHSRVLVDLEYALKPETDPITMAHFQIYRCLSEKKYHNR